jgi:hypothetical protein
MKKVRERYFKAAILVWILALLALSLFLAGCNGVQASISKLEGKPRLRKGAYFGSVIPPTYLGPGQLGEHNSSERNGYVYCSKGGFIDTDHLRKSADWTKLLSDMTFEHIIKSDREFSFRLREPTKYHVKLEYPQWWQHLSDEQQQDMAREISIYLGQYFAHTACVWHEILTWYGWTWTEIGSEYMSAFSWDDIYSNLLGSRIGAKAMRDPENDFNKAVTLQINLELERLDAQPADVARRAADQIHGQWYTGGFYFFVDTKKRHLDVGLDGYVSPWIVPGICEEDFMISYRVPDTYFVEKFGFKLKLEIEPRERIKGKILKVVFEDEKNKRLQPDLHFPIIMDHVKGQAQERYGFNVDLPW